MQRQPHQSRLWPGATLPSVIGALGPGLLVTSALAHGLPPQDAEANTHADEASTPQMSFEQRGDEFTLRQYQLGCLSHLSYLVVSGDEALVIDPQRDVEHYLRDASELGASVRYVALTHPHADFVAGHTELASLSGATILIGTKARAEFAHRALADGDRISLGALTLEAWDTPGHTPNAQTLLLRKTDAQFSPIAAFTGDTLFIGSIGRPDLLDVPPAELASASFDSLQRLAGLPDACLVLPAHGAGSLCGAHLSPDTVSTIGRERATNPYFQFTSRSSFIANVISHQPVAPQYFAFNVELNRKGPPLVSKSSDLPPAIEASALAEALEQDAFLVDLRDQEEYANGHIRGAINVCLRGRLDTWTGIVVPVDAPLYLLGSEAEVREGTFRLRRIGYDEPRGYLRGGMEAWRAAGLNERQTPTLSIHELHEALREGREPILIDVRTREEYEDLRLADVGNIPLTESERFARTFPKSEPIVMLCNSAYRSSMAIGLAERLGFSDLRSLSGGLDAWISAGYPLLGRLAEPAASASIDKSEHGVLRLPEAIEPSQLARSLMDQPESYALFDLRPAWQFAEWHLAEAESLAPDALLERLAQVESHKRIVLVDRDGSLAFALAGLSLARAPERDLRVLAGGLQRYHRELVLPGRGLDYRPETANASSPATSRQPRESAPSQPAPNPQKPRKAGC